MNKKNISPESVFNMYEKGVTYKRSEKLYQMAEQNENFYASIQWKGVTAKNMPKPTLNFIPQVVDTKISFVISDSIKLLRKPDEISAFEEDEVVKKAADVFTQLDKKNWERSDIGTSTDMKGMNQRLLFDAALTGIGVSFWYWDKNIRTGNSFTTSGDFIGELIDMTNFYVSNPNEVDVQKQEYVILSSRMSVSRARKLASDKGVSDDDLRKITSTSDQDEEGFSKSQNQQNDGDETGQTTVLLKLWKDDDTGTVHFIRSSKEVLFGEPIDTKLRIFPIAIMQWRPRKRFIYGTAEVTDMITNQQAVNKLQALRILSTMLTAAPKGVYNKNKVKGVTNLVGGMIGVDGDGDINNVMKYVQPSQITLDIDKASNAMVTMTREFKGLNENALGISRPENTSALLAQQKASSVPHENIKRRFHGYVKDVGEIWGEFYRTQYDLKRKIVDEEKNEIIEFVGTDYKDVFLKTSVDVGSDNQYDDLAGLQILKELVATKDISVTQYLERIPKNLIPDQVKLIGELGGDTRIAQEFKYEMMARTLESLDDEMKAKIMNLKEDKREEVIMQLALENKPQAPQAPQQQQQAQQQQQRQQQNIRPEQARQQADKQTNPNRGNEAVQRVANNRATKADPSDRVKQSINNR